jgi:hypothetical protein
LVSYCLNYCSYICILLVLFSPGLFFAVSYFLRCLFCVNIFICMYIFILLMNYVKSTSTGVCKCWKIKINFDGIIVSILQALQYLTRSLYYKLCYCRAIFEVVTALFDLEYFIKRFCMCNSSYRGIPQNLFYA